MASGVTPGALPSASAGASPGACKVRTHPISSTPLVMVLRQVNAGGLTLEKKHESVERTAATVIGEAAVAFGQVGHGLGRCDQRVISANVGPGHGFLGGGEAPHGPQAQILDLAEIGKGAKSCSPLFSADST